MEPNQDATRSVDVTGLSDEAIRAVETLVTALRDQPSGTSAYRSREEWCKALREWAESHKRLDRPADWSRDTIYAERRS